MSIEIPLRQLFRNQTTKNYRMTDKNRGIREHLGLYEILFEEYRDSATKVFEVGVNRGGSIRVWREYFHNAEIYALDNRARTLARFANVDRITGVVIDQSDAEQLEAFAELGQFDIGIDDGSHIWPHQILTFEKLWPAIKPGGMFVVEDVLTSYEKWIREAGRRTDFYGGTSISCMDYFKNMIDEINCFGGDIDQIPEEDLTPYQNTVDWVCFRHNSIFIRKRADA